MTETGNGIEKRRTAKSSIKSDGKATAVIVERYGKYDSGAGTFERSAGVHVE